MLQGSFVIAVALGYIGLLFVVASYGDRAGRFRRDARWRLIYPLSLAIYCTSWTFFGSVGLASRNGFDFLTIYLGPMLMIGLGSPVIMRVVRLAKAQNITSIADFIAARYGKAQTVAATVALIAIIGTIPYIALQLKAVSSSLSTILGHLRPESDLAQPVFGDISLFVALSMATFAVLFGTRHIDATEHQDGLMLAVATEFDRQARRLSRRRHFRDFLDVRWPSSAFVPRARTSKHRGRADLAANGQRHNRHDAPLAVRHCFVAAPVPRHGGREQ